MNSLAQTQAAMWAAVRARTVSPAPLTHFRDHGRLCAADRLTIYRSAYWARLVNALRSLFPTVVSRVGDAHFAQLASRSIAMTPTSGWAIEDSGAAFVDFLEASVASHADLSVMADVARIEWAMWQVFVAVDGTIVSLERLQTLPLEQCRLTVGQHVRVVQTSAEAARVMGLEGVEQQSAPISLVVWRTGHQVSMRVVSATVASAVTSAHAGVAFQTWCEQLSSAFEAAQLAQELVAWAERGWFSACEVMT